MHMAKSWQDLFSVMLKKALSKELHSNARMQKAKFSKTVLQVAVAPLIYLKTKKRLCL